MAAALSAALSGCGSDEVTTTVPVQRVVVTPSTALITTVGGTRQLAAEALDADGQPVLGVAISWTSDDEAVGSVDGQGRVTATGAGSAVIRASAQGVTGRADLVVVEADGPPILFAGGDVVTLDPVERVEEAVVVLDDRIYATGPAAELRDLVGPEAVELDLAGQAVVPGFVDPHLGREFVHEVRVATERIAELPESGSPDPDETGIRRAVLARFPFILVYQRVGDAVEVIAVMHQRQKPGYWGNRK